MPGRAGARPRCCPAFSPTTTTGTGDPELRDTEGLLNAPEVDMTLRPNRVSGSDVTGGVECPMVAGAVAGLHRN